MKCQLAQIHSDFAKKDKEKSTKMTLFSLIIVKICIELQFAHVGILSVVYHAFDILFLFRFKFSNYPKAAKVQISAVE